MSSHAIVSWKLWHVGDTFAADYISKVDHAQQGLTMRERDLRSCSDFLTLSQ